VARTHSKAPVFIDGVGFRLETAYWCTRDLAYPNYVAMAAQDAYAMAGITKPDTEIDIYEPYDPFNYKALHHMNALLLDKSGRKVRELFDAGAFARDGSHPICPSGGALGVGNPIAATGLMKIAELYFQLSGQAGKRQVAKSAHRGVAQAWGDLMQVGTVVVMSSEGALPSGHGRWGAMTAKDLPATPLKQVQDVPHIAYKPDLRYSYDNGYALTSYLEGFKQGALRGSRCTGCGRIMIPPRSFCELCNLQPVHDYCELPDTGTVQTYTLSHVNWDSSPLPRGRVDVFAVIAIDGAAPEMGLVHRLGEVSAKDVKIGMKVRAVWKDAKDREGSVLDIKYFRPLGTRERNLRTVKPIKPAEIDAASAKSFPGRIPMEYLYTAGLGGSRFYADLAKGRLSGTWCSHCEAVHVPPTAFCEFGMVLLDVDKQARAVNVASGVVLSFTEVHEDRSGHLLDAPVVVAQVGYPGTVGSLFGVLELRKGQAAQVGAAVELVPTGKKVGPEHVKFRLKAARRK